MNTFKTFVASLTLVMLPVLAGAQGTITNPGSGTISNPGNKLQNPLAGGVDSIYKLLVLVLNNIIIPIGSVIIVIMIIYSGFLFVTARGNSDKIEDAKRTLLYVVIGAAILLGSAVIAAAIGGTLCQIAPGLAGCAAGSPGF